MKMINQALEYLLYIVASHTCTFLTFLNSNKLQTQLLITNY